jgi:hypothetical protein
MRGRVKGLKFQTETRPLFVILRVQVFESDRRSLGAGLPQAHARPAIVFGDELDAGRFQGVARLEGKSKRHWRIKRGNTNIYDLPV